MGCIFDIFAWTWNFWGGRTENTSKQQKIAAFGENFLSGDDFEAVLAMFCFYCCDANPSENCYKWKRLSQMLLMSYGLLYSHKIFSIFVKNVVY